MSSVREQELNTAAVRPDSGIGTLMDPPVVEVADDNSPYRSEKLQDTWVLGTAGLRWQFNMTQLSSTHTNGKRDSKDNFRLEK
jgi:hypothetical protein